ncbi:ChaN family lipoprotein [Vibrio ostreicida]|uniref:ChaN family lipoprotein n=1 Tax=Vibrio ostreicida TaxID=526588 RepID=A0ABT8BS90_9VIBR|nr:ChaN family lipoprotein [Vibrio ostreicida]MDN3609568.1 ChaN family lipoprotein [Vibrio ostreicida]NPD08441.1 hypothetical protein [Vibrio ostreicida]
MHKLTSLALIAFSLSACSTLPEPKVSNFYDYQLYSPDARPLTLTALPNKLIDADVILVGEFHTHPGIHHFQTDLLQRLTASATQSSKRVTLSMEQFSRESQPVLNNYLSGQIGEQTLMQNANAWPNYESDYRPLMELAKTHQIDVIAANAPKSIVRCVGRQGLDYLDKLSPKQRLNIAKNIETSPSPYKQKFMASMHHGQSDQTEKQFAAQMVWDETMAESITNHLEQYPNAQVLHIAGRFHIEQGLGTKASILNRNPDLNVVVVSPVLEPSTDSHDFQLKVLDLPVRYQQRENRNKAYQKLSQRHQDLTCL